MQGNIKHTIALMVTVFAVTACGGGSSDSSGSVTQETPLAVSAMNASSSLTIIQAQDVSLDSMVTSSDNKAAYIDNVTPLNDYTSEHCSSEYRMLNLNVKSTEVGVCAYQYTVALAEDSSVTSTAMSFSSVQGLNGGSSISLTPISLALQMGDVVTVNLPSELGSDYSTDMVLDDDSIIILGDESTAVTTNSTDSEITITAGSETGHTRVYYTMTNEKAGIVEQGVIDIAVNDTVNHAPTADDFQLDDVVQSETTISIDVGDSIDDVDGDTLKLVEVLTVNAQATILEDTDPDFVNNTSFEFTAAGLGERVVTYVVADQMGGYAIGNVTLNLTGGAGEVVVSWSDITINDNTIDDDITFTAPLSTEFANLLKVEYSAEYTEDGETGPNGYKIALMGYQEAEEFCEYKSARLPTPRELALLKTKEGNTASSNLYDNQSWPIGREYWSALSDSETTAQTYDFYGLTASTLDNSSDKANVTCVLLSGEVQDFSMERLSADSRIDEVTTYSTNVTDPEGEPAAYKQVYVSSKGQNGDFEADGVSGKSLALKTDIDGNVSFTYTETNPVNEIIVSQFSSTELNTIYKTDDEFRTTSINVYDPTLWNRYAHDGGDLTDMSDGLSIFNENGTYATETTNMYVNPINALEWEVFVTVESEPLRNGRYTIFLTQVTPDKADPDEEGSVDETWEEMVQNWGDSNAGDLLMAGAPDGDDRDFTITLVANKYTGGVGYDLSNEYDYSTTAYDDEVLLEKTYYWITRYIDDSGTHYLSFHIGSTPDKDEATEIMDRDMTRYLNFNPFNDFYLGFGGVENGTTADTYINVTNVTVSTFE